MIQSFSKLKGNYLISRNLHNSLSWIDIVQQPADIIAMTKSNDSSQYLGPDTQV